MKPTLKDYPTDGEWMSAFKWKEQFRKKLRDIDTVKWFEENVYEDWTWEGLLEKFIDEEILG